MNILFTQKWFHFSLILYELTEDSAKGFWWWNKYITVGTDKGFGLFSSPYIPQIPNGKKVSIQ
jgi:hypothetical protein